MRRGKGPNGRCRMGLRYLIPVVLLSVTVVLAQAIDVPEDPEQETSNVQTAADKEWVLDDQFQAIAIQRQNATAFNRKGIILALIGVAVLTAGAYFVARRKKYDPQKLEELAMLEGLEVDAQKLADIIGTKKAQLNAQSLSSHLAAAQTAKKELNELKKKGPPSSAEEKKLLRAVTRHVREAVTLLRHLHASARRAAKQSPKPPPPPYNTWEVTASAIIEMSSDEFVSACKEALRAAEDEFSTCISEAWEARTAMMNSPVLNTPQQGWYLRADVALLLDMKTYEKRVEEAAKLMLNTNAIVLQELKELTIRRSRAELEALKKEGVNLVAGSVIAKAAMETADAEDKKALAEFVKETVAIKDKYKELQSEQSALESVTDPHELVAASQKIFRLHDAAIQAVSACISKAPELDKALMLGKAAYPDAARLLKDTAATAVERIGQIHQEISETMDRVWTAHTNLFDGLPPSAKRVYGPKVVQRLFDGITHVAQLTAIVYAQAKTTAGKLKEAKSLKKTAKRASEIHDKASQAEGLGLMAAALDHAVSLLIVLERDMAMSYETMIVATNFLFSPEARPAAVKALRSFKHAIRTARNVDTLDALAEAQYAMRASSVDLNRLMSVSKHQSAAGVPPKTETKPSQEASDGQTTRRTGVAGHKDTEDSSNEMGENEEATTGESDDSDAKEASKSME